jgi:hypothetical protein
VFTDTDVYNFYFTKFDKILFSGDNIVWTASTNDVNIGTGYFQNKVDLSLLKVGTYSTNNLKYISPGANVKFTAPTGQSFKNGNLVTTDTTDATQKSFIWTKVISVAGDGTNAGTGANAKGVGPVVFNDNVPSGAVASRIVPKFVSDLSDALESSMVTQAFANLNFGLRFEQDTASWKIIQNQNLNLTASFSLGKTGDISNNNLDSSWIVAFVKENDEYVVRIRTLNYVFGSKKQNRFYFDKNEKAYNNLTGKVEKDMINVLGINSLNVGIGSLIQDYPFEVSDTIAYDDGYESASEIKLGFRDSDADGVIDNPESFVNVVGEDLDLKYLFFKSAKDEYGTTIYNIIDTAVTPILIIEKESLVNVNNYTDGQLIYFYDVAQNRVKRVDRTTNTLVLESTYKACIGRDNLKFQYTHSASEDRRIDPSVTNIIDLFVLTRSYDTSFKNYLVGATTIEPIAPSSDELRIAFGIGLSAIKSISDEVVYHPVKYKVLFGAAADTKLQAKFKVVKNTGKTINDNNLKVRIVNAMNDFFDINNWDFGDRFYLSELSTYVLNVVSPDISNLVILPRQSSQAFGSLFEIQSKPDEIFANGATVDDIEIVTSITAAEINAATNSIVSNT